MRSAICFILFAYDLNGNLTSATEKEDGVTIATTGYTWDAMGRLQTATTPAASVIYAYDHDGRRTGQTVNGTDVTRTLWDEFSTYGDVLLEYDGANTLLTRYTRDNAQPLAQTQGGSTHYVLSDGQHSTRLLTDTAGNVTDTYAYTAFGELLTQTGTTSNSYLYTRQWYDALTEQYNLRARNYSPANGRFTSVDRYPYVIGNPQEHNRYVYVANNPLRYVDPSGFGFVDNALIHTIEQIKAKPGLTLYGAGVACMYYNVVSVFPGANLGGLPYMLCGSSVSFDFPPMFPNIPPIIPGFEEIFPNGFDFPNIDGFPSDSGLDLPFMLEFPNQPWLPWWLLPFIPPVVDDGPFVLDSSKILGDNLIASGQPKPGENYHAHHIVPQAFSDVYSVEAREILTEFLGINDAENGVWLEKDNHYTIHTLLYRYAVLNALEGTDSREDLVRRLNSLREAILKGIMPY